MVDISVIVPVYNERESVKALYSRLVGVLHELGKTYEIIFVDDGSRDGSLEVLKDLNSRDDSVRIIRFRRNFGQTAAMDAGFKNASGKTIVSMDADLQNDPSDIPTLLDRMDEGFDAVCGWRYDRKDSIPKRIMSLVANKMRNILVGDSIHDSGCSLRAYTSEAAKDLELYGEMHRYIPTLLMWKGYRVSEVKVKHHPREHGKTKYGAGRLLRGMLDLITVKFLVTYNSSPLHLFGIPGIISTATGLMISAYLAYIRVVHYEPISSRPLLSLGVLLILLGVQFISIGLLGELITNRFFAESNLSTRRQYSIKEIIE
ncbi:MAG: glycosyltransferase family 2 protein [Candidatus Altiarchaeota archaeon]